MDGAGRFEGGAGIRQDKTRQGGEREEGMST
jgi:hypothetical protein